MDYETYKSSLTGEEIEEILLKSKLSLTDENINKWNSNNGYTKDEVDNLIGYCSKNGHLHTKYQIIDFPTKLSEFENDINAGGEGGGAVDAYTKEQIDTMLAEYAALTHIHTKSQITDFPTNLSQFVNDLAVGEGGTGQKIFAADIVDYGAKIGDGVFNTTSKTYSNMTDCTQAVKDAIAAGYGIIIFPAKGKFKINGPISITSKLIILGCGAEIYCDPVNASNRNVFVFSTGANGSKVYSLNFKSENVYTANLNNATALSSNCFAFNIAGNTSGYISDIHINDCAADGFRYFVSIIKARYIYMDGLYGKNNYFTIYTGYDVDKVFLRNSVLFSQAATDIYGHILYLGDNTKGVEVDNCWLEADGNHNNLIKCGSDENSAYCKNIKIKNSTIIGVSSTSFLYAHAYSESLYENCNMIFSASGSSAYPRLMQFNNNAVTKFRNCNFTLDSVQRFTHTDSTLTNNSLIFEDCNFTIKNTINTNLTFDLTAGAKDFKLIKCVLDYSNVSKAINIMKPALYALQVLNCTLKLPSGSMCGYSASNSVSYTQTQSPKLLLNNTTIEMPSGNTTSFFGYVKGSTSALAYLINVTLLNGANSSGNYMLASSNYSKIANVNAIPW
jgi:hypothetical protein